MTASNGPARVAAPANPLRRLRRERELSQAALAEMIGTQRTTIAAWEQGKQRPQRRFVDRLAAALGVDAAVLAPLRQDPSAPVLRIASRDPGSDAEAAAETAIAPSSAGEPSMAGRFAECLLDGLSRGHAADPAWLAAAEGTARLLGVPWAPVWSAHQALSGK